MASILESTDKKNIEENIKNGNYFFYLFFILKKNNINNRGINTNEMYYDGDKWNNSEKISVSINHLYNLLKNYYMDNDLDYFKKIVVLKKDKKFISIRENNDGSLTINQHETDLNNSILAYGEEFNKYFFISAGTYDLAYKYHKLEHVEETDLSNYINENFERTNKKSVQQ